MQQRIGLACALLPDPALLFLDEPTSALDPLGRREVREIILGLKRQGKTVFLNSHLLSEVEMICDQVAMIRGGRIVASGSIDDLLSGSLQLEMEIGDFSEAIRAALGDGGRRVSVIRPDTDLRRSPIDGLWGPNGETVLVRAEIRERDEVPALAEAVVRAGGRLYSLRHLHNSLEDLFVELMKGGRD